MPVYLYFPVIATGRRKYYYMEGLELMKKKSVAILLVLALALSLSTFALPAVAAGAFEWWDLRGYEEGTFDKTVVDTSSDFAGWRTIDLAYKGETITVTHYWGWYAETPNNTDQRIDIYIPSNATAKSPLLHMVCNYGWFLNFYHSYLDTSTTPGTLTSAFGGPVDQALEALQRGMVIIQSGARAGLPDIVPGAEASKSPATMADTKAAIRFVRANMAPGMKLYGKGNPDLIFVTGTSGGGALSNIVGASGNNADYFASQYDIGALGINWTGSMPYASATLAEKANKANWSNTISDAYQGVLSWCPMDFFGMGEQESEWFYNEKRWLQSDTTLKTADIMTISNTLASYIPGYITALGLKDENGALLAATYDYDDIEEGGTADGSFMDAVIRLMERGIETAINNWADGIEVETGTSSLADLYNNAGIRDNIRINGEPVTGPVDRTTYPKGSTVEITDRTQFLIGLDDTALPYFFAFSYDPASNFSDFLGNLFSDGSFFNKEAWDIYEGSIMSVGKTNTSDMEWDDYLKTDAGQLRAFQIKTSSAIPYLNARNLSAFSYLDTADFYGDNSADVASYWRPRYGMNDQQMGYGGQAVFYYSLLNNSAVKTNMSDLKLFNWNWGHSGDYDNIETAMAWIEACVADYYYQPQTGGGGGGVTNYSVTFNTNGGSAVTSISVAAGNKLTKPSDPVRQGYTFAGWYTDSAFTKEYDFASNVTGGITLYAKWTENPKPITPTMPVNPFTDVIGTDWFIDDVIYAYSIGLIDGTTPSTFAPNSNLKYSEAVKLAACMHQLYTTGEVTLENGDPWYQSYIDYAKANGIIVGDYDWEAIATRAGYIEIFANALPDSAYAEINNVADGAIPDVPMDHPQAAAIYKLYRAGILQGNNSTYSFSPDTGIRRSEVAAILTRMMNPDARIKFTI